MDRIRIGFGSTLRDYGYGYSDEDLQPKSVSDPKHWVGKTNAVSGKRYRGQEGIEAKGAFGLWVLRWKRKVGFGRRKGRGQQRWAGAVGGRAEGSRGRRWR
jgi:hypothetical protein